MTRKIIIAFYLITIASFSKMYAQPIELYNTFFGKYDYTAIGNTMNPVENQLNALNPIAYPCNILTSSSANLNLAPGQTVVAAYLYWAGSGTGDFNVTLNGNPIVADREFHFLHMQSGLQFPIFGAFADVTPLVQTIGNGTYTLSDLDLTAVVPNYCPIGLNFAGWSIVVVYEDPTFSNSLVLVYDGFEQFGISSVLVSELNFTLQGLNVTEPINNKIGFLVWEGDVATSVNENLKVNGVTLTNPPLNPANNMFNGTNSFTGSNTFYNMDLDYFDISDVINVGDTSLDVQFTSSQDFVLLHHIVLVLSNELPDATVAINNIDGLDICGNRELTVNYTVSNIDGTEILPAGTPISFYADNTLLATVNTTADIAVGGSASYTVVLNIPAGIPDNFELMAVADDDGTGTGIQQEVDESNNTAITQIQLSPALSVDISDLDMCSDTNTAVFNLTTAFTSNPDWTVTFYTSEANANNQTSAIATPAAYSSGNATIWVRIDNNNAPQCYQIESFDITVLQNPIITQPGNLTVCDDNGDGFTTFNLTQLVPEILGGTIASVTFHTTLADAQQGINNIPNPESYTNTVANTQTIYVRVQNGDCYSTTSFQIIVSQQPEINQPTGFSVCSSTPQAIFNLTEKNAEILNGNSYTLSFHTSLSAAQNGTGAIADPIAYSSGTQTIYVRAESGQNCFAITSFDIVVNLLPSTSPITPYEFCSSDDSEFATFDLTSKTDEILDGQVAAISFYTTLADAENGISPIANPAAYNNVSNPQTIYVRIEGQAGCFAVNQFDLIVHQVPDITAPNPLEYCDDNNDGIGIFNLESVINDMTGGNTAVSVTFHLTPEDAQFGANALANPTAYINNTPIHQVIYVRVATQSGICPVVIPLDLYVHLLPEITDPEPLEMCDDDYDGFVGFNLSVATAEILGGLNPLNYEVSFYVTEADANSDTNEIVNITDYVNQTINEDTVWVRVNDLNTGCYALTELTLIVNPLPIVAMPEVDEYHLCDLDGDGYVEFDLQTQIAGIVNGQTGLTVTFHDTYQDAELNQNAYTYLHTNNEPFIETVFVRVTTEKGCYVITLMDLVADPLPTLAMPLEPVISCEGDGDGYGVFNLEELIEDLLNGADPAEFQVTFYETYNNAVEYQNPIQNLQAYFNIDPFVQDIYINVTNIVSGCFTVYTLTLEVAAAPQLPVDADNLLPEIEICDDNFDGFAYFDFTEQTNYIMAAQPDTTNLVVTYHQTQQDAENGTLAIATPDHYLNISNPQTIWVRLENSETECFDTASFEITVNIPLEIPDDLQLVVCDTDSDGEVFFDLTSMNPVILANASNPNNYQVDFYLSLEDAQNDDNVIPNPENFSNLVLGPDGPYTVFVAVTNLVTGCKSYKPMTIVRAPMPNPMTDNLVALELCDAVTEDDMMEEFDLTVYEGYIRNGNPNLILSYHLTEEDAQNNENPIPNPEAYFTGSTTIYIRVSNQPIGTQSCAVVIELDVVVNPLPTVAQNYFAICEENSTGYAQFDLNGFTPTLLGPDQNPAEFLVEYYLTLADAEHQTNPINQGVPFENTTQGSETIYVHIYNTITECERVAALTLYAEEAAVANPVDDITLCDYDGTNDGVLEINLDDYWKDTVLGGQDPMQFAVTYHLSEADAQNDVNAIANPTAYSNTDSPYSQTIYIRVENTNTLSPCYDIAVAQILIEGLAEPVITSDYTHICVDYDTREVVRTVTLDSNVTDPNYTFEWYHNGTLIAGATGSTYTIEQFGGEGEYYVIATSTAPYFGCSSEPSAPMVIGLSGPATIVEILPTNAFADQQDIIVTVNGYGEYMYQLDNGPLQDTGHFVNVSPGAHVITVYDVLPGNGDVDDYNNCDAIPVENVSVVNYPHYFTPNGDGYHDRWNITGLNAYHNAEIYIFDRYGKLLKQLNPTGEGWDGTYNGTPLPASDYWFKVVYDEPVTDAEGNTTTRRKEFKAHFSIKR